MPRSILVSRLTLLCALVMLVLGVRVANASAAAAWVAVSPSAEPFSVRMPTAPERRKAATETIVGDVMRVSYAARSGGRGFVVTRIDLPGVATFFMSDEALFQNVREGFLEYGETVETSYLKIVRGDTPGMRLEFKKKDKGAESEIRAEFFLVDGQMLTFMGEAPAGDSLSDIDRFHESISFKDGE